MRRIIITTFVMFLPILASADDSGSCGENVTYKYEESTHTLTISGEGTMDNFDYSNIPWLANRETLTTVIIESGVTSIGSYAFSYCPNLSSITIPNTVTSINDFAFQSSSGLETIAIPGSISTIGYQAFSYCSGLTSITIPEGTTTIENYAFSNCSALTTVTISSSVESLGSGVFGYCSNLSSIIVESGNETYDSRDDCNAIIKTSTNELIAGCKNTIIPQNIKGIGNSAFSNCTGLTAITIPDGVTVISLSAFQWCTGLTSVTLPNSVTSIGNNAFEGCKSLESVTIPKNVSEIGENAFNGCPDLGSIVVESGNETFDSRNNCNAIIESATNSLVFGCKNTIIPAGVTSIGYNAFANCSSLLSITIPEGVLSIENNAFSQCNGLMSITIPASVTTIGSGAFQCCESLTEITIPNSVNSIGSSAFYDCTSLTSFTIPASTSTIEDGLFQACSGLTTVIIHDKVTSIGEYAFGGCSSMKSITIPSCVTTIDEGAFAGCSGMESATIFDGVTTIGKSAFSGCSNLTSITIPQSVSSIGSYAFRNCNNLTVVRSEILNPFEIENDVFTNYNDDAVLVVPKGAELTYHTTEGWNSFTNITGPVSVGDVINYRGISYLIGEDNSLTVISKEGNYSDMVTIPERIKFVDTAYSVTSIGNNAFSGSTGLTSIIIPTSINSIGNGAFSGCTGLTSIYSLNSTPTPCGINPFSSVDKEHCVLWVPKGKVGSYGGADSWKVFNDVREIDDDVNLDDKVHIGCCGENAIYCYEVVSQTLIISGEGAMYDFGNWEHKIPWYDFVNDIKEIIIDSGVTTIGCEAFQSCYYLTSLTISNSVISIGKKAFQDCRRLASITIPSSVTSIGAFAFRYCPELTSVTIPKSVTDIGENPFTNCVGLSSIVVENGNDTYDSHNQCNAIIESKTNTLIAGCKNTVIPENIASIGDYALSSLVITSPIIIPNSVTSIGEEAFSYNDGLVNIYSLNRTPPSCEISAFCYIDKESCVLWVPKGCSEAYLDADGWSDFLNVKEIKEGDVNLDDEVDSDDRDAIVTFIMGRIPEVFYKCLADLNNDNKVNAADLVLFVNAVRQVK